MIDSGVWWKMFPLLKANWWKFFERQSIFRLLRQYKLVRLCVYVCVFVGVWVYLSPIGFYLNWIIFDNLCIDLFFYISLDDFPILIAFSNTWAGIVDHLNLYRSIIVVGSTDFLHLLQDTAKDTPNLTAFSEFSDSKLHLQF